MIHTLHRSAEGEVAPRAGTARMGWAALYGTVYAALLALLLWSHGFERGYLIAAGALVFLGVVGWWVVKWRTQLDARRAPFVLLALGTLLLAVGAGSLVDQRLGRLAAHWDEVVLERREQLGRELGDVVSRAMARGGAAAERAAEGVGGSGMRDPFEVLSEIRVRSGVEALALFDETGEVVAWAGEHHGPLPAAVRGGEAGVAYADRPLFSYLYVSRPVPGRSEHAVAAILLQTGLGSDAHGLKGVAERFAERRGARPFFAAGAGSSDAWSLTVDGAAIAHAHFEPITQAGWRAQVGNMGRRAVLPLAALALALLALGWVRSAPWRGVATAVPLLGTTLALALAPLGPALGAERLFSPALFLLPVYPEITLGRLLAILLPLAALTAAARPVILDERRGRGALLVGVMAVGLGFPAALRLLVDGAAPSLAAEGAAYWGAFQLAALLLLTMLAGLALPQSRPRPLRGAGAQRRRVRRRQLRKAPLIAGVLLALVLGGAVLARWRMAQRIDLWFPALWAIPFALLAFGVMPHAGRSGRLLRWLMAAWLAASAVLPHLWVRQVEARLQSAERGLATLGSRPDPYLDYLLHQFSSDVTRREARGEEGVAMLYRSWVASGLAREGYPARIGLWTEGGREVLELPLGDGVAVGRGGSLPAAVRGRVLEEAWGTGQPVLEPGGGTPAAGRLLAVPLQSGQAVTVFVPPRRSLDRPTVLAPLLGPEANPDMRLTLVPMLGGWAHEGEGVRWMPTAEGWRSETLLRYPDGEYHAHLDVHVPPLGVLFARGVLLLALDLGVLALLWALGRAGRGELPAPPGGWAAWAGSFRSRVTLALFAFFLLPTGIFGVLAYRALAGEAARTAQAVAERAATQAVSVYPELPGHWRSLASRVGEEVLYYHRGELAQASSPEAVELGVFGAWMPPSVFRALSAGEEIGTVESRQLGQRAYVVAYRRLPAGTLAVPVSLVAAESANRQRELADLVLFAILVGGVLSLALSVAVGRALARPIGQLRRASAAIGGGRLSVRLPTTGGEFGELFASFNRMVRRLRRARAQEVRAARVLAWGEMSRQVAHEIKNPLTPIKLSVQHLKRAYGDGRADFGEILNSNVEEILREIDRLTEISRAFSRYGAPAEEAGPLEAVELAPVVYEALTLYRAGEPGVHYRPELEPGLPPVRARAGELKEVLLNLLENAHTALDGRGRVAIRARRDGDAVELVVQDDGPGVPPELLNRIFEPHFSTRSTGTGLGLAIVRRLVEGWGGSVVAESRPGEGAAIRIRVRIAEPAQRLVL